MLNLESNSSENLSLTQTAQQKFSRVRITNPPFPHNPSFPIDPVTGEKYEAGKLLVKFEASTTDIQIQSIAASVGAQSVQDPFPATSNPNPLLDSWRILQFDPQANLLEIRSILSQNHSVTAIDYNYQVSIEGVPNDPYFNYLWGLNNLGQTGGIVDADIDAPEALDILLTGNKPIVAVIDSGIDYNHPDLAANIWTNSGEVPGNGFDDDGNGYIDDFHGYDWSYNDGDPMDDNTHGTHVAGTIGAVRDNGIGIAGVAPNVSLMPLKFLAQNGMGTIEDAAFAVIYATQMGADVINASFGGGGFSQFMYDALAYANNQDVLFVAAAGNDNNDNDFNPSFPASYDLPNIISVAATDYNDQRAEFSNYGFNSVDLAAPGVSIFSTLPGNKYGWYSGTSMASPHVAGAAALLLAQNPSLSALQLKDRLLSTTDPIASMQGLSVTGGRLNLLNAVQTRDSKRYADFDGDGKTDFLRQEKGVWDDDNDNTAGIFFANGDGTFEKYDLTPDWWDLKGDDGVNLILGDFNGDGKTDFIRQEKGAWDDDNFNTANVFFSNGDGTFVKFDLTPYRGDLGEDAGVNLVVGDYNGDGKDDFIRQEKNGLDDDDVLTAEVFMSNGDGSFSSQLLTEWWTMKGDFTNLIVGDYNGDGKDDFIRQEKGDWDDDNGNTANIFFSSGDGTFAKFDLTPDYGNLGEDAGSNLIVGDYNGDGKDDFIRQEKNGWDDDDDLTAEVFMSNGDGSFSRQLLTEWWTMKGDFTNLIVGDYNGDGKDDFIRQEKGDWDDDNGNTANVFFSSGDGTFVKFDLTPDYGNLGEDAGIHLIVGDYNGDGKDDFIRQEKNGWDDDDDLTAEVFISNGNGLFSRQLLTEWWTMKGDLTNLIV
jgi:subtilisin family serine protease